MVRRLVTAQACCRSLHARARGARRLPSGVIAASRCMPRRPQSYEEDTSFMAMRSSADLLYLGGTVLVMLDDEYLNRFETSVGAWLSMQTCTPTGLRRAENPEVCSCDRDSSLLYRAFACFNPLSLARAR
eukprot:2808-Prymnesium_polylepis.1